MKKVESGENFDETSYLLANPDVADAIDRGYFESGWRHYEKFGRSEGRSLSLVAANAKTHSLPLGFEQRAPSHQTAIDVFRGRWASDLKGLLGVDGTGPHDLFIQDNRPAAAARVLGVDDRLDGYQILELGPLEGAHTYRLEQLGASSVTAVEGSVEAFLKCLIVKESLGLRSQFYLGDISEYLNLQSKKFDLIFCSGVLYHSVDPLLLIQLIGSRTDKCFVWTHYYLPDGHPHKRYQITREHQGFAASYWSKSYVTQDHWGGNKAVACWMQKDEIVQAFRHFGFNDIKIVDEDTGNPSGPSFSFCAQRS